ncbi:hypothetical protein PV332_10550 [Streptomyces scabiei]|uniref:hypothetical protein n=1 Tax=Streptomyces scabiei TaxID=1930 RepID=UPI0029AF8D2C|nr:hypothetical protein [Streptomyces scabiei]MDX2575920.1 hypothetical protein [Streptomyces scabiei]MDX2885607.1 hypothetical protein [Streptomyces scabiei]MDX2993440.1 hypothetical protein [Streptomyces scabiei]MDX3028446.1 hypothetical protein [Streptomyces scabiei]MDX3047220.1 hypothetical protein [Streptomyces scabiei]
MTPFLAALIFETWAAQFDAEADVTLTQAYHNVIAQERPHLYAPMVPETFRGPKWGRR